MKREDFLKGVKSGDVVSVLQETYLKTKTGQEDLSKKPVKQHRVMFKVDKVNARKKKEKYVLTTLDGATSITFDSNGESIEDGDVLTHNFTLVSEDDDRFIDYTNNVEIKSLKDTITNNLNKCNDVSVLRSVATLVVNSVLDSEKEKSNEE